MKKQETYSEQDRLVIKRAAERRLRAYEVPNKDCKRFLNEGIVPKIVCDYVTNTFREDRLTKKDIHMIRLLEQKYDMTIFYMVDDKILLDRERVCNRLIFLYVLNKKARKYKVDGPVRKRKAGIIPIYAYNLNIPQFSEFGSSYYRNLGGMILAH